MTLTRYTFDQWLDLYGEEAFREETHRIDFGDADAYDEGESDTPPRLPWDLYDRADKTILLFPIYQRDFSRDRQRYEDATGNTVDFVRDFAA